MNRRSSFSKLITHVVFALPFVKRVYKTLQISADHLLRGSYGKKARFFIYNSKRLHELESLSLDAGINVMVINIQALNALGADHCRIYEELDDFQSRNSYRFLVRLKPGQSLILDDLAADAWQENVGGSSKVRPADHPSLFLLTHLDLTMAEFIGFLRWMPTTRNWSRRLSCVVSRLAC